MIFAGCDVGSLTAKTVLIDSNSIIASRVIRVSGSPEMSAGITMKLALDDAGLGTDSVTACCSTGYGRMGIPFATMNMSEISCHALGAFWLDNSIRTVIDIGGQDCKVIEIDGAGMVRQFAMNDKCAAGTGRSLEILARTSGIGLENLGPLSLKAKKPATITNRCSIFMELELLQHLYARTDPAMIALGINEAVAKRVFSLAGSISFTPSIAITGGVSKNSGVVRELERLTGHRFTTLGADPQIAGALGAALFAMKTAQGDA